jgi:hypothetical protein
MKTLQNEFENNGLSTFFCVILKIEFFLETQKKEYKKGRSQIPENLG